MLSFSCCVVGAILFRFSFSAWRGCGGGAWSILVQRGTPPEYGWVLAHWLGLRNLAPFVRKFPGYSSAIFSAPPRQTSSEQPAIALTIDDFVGKNATGAELLLDLLDELAVPATFFVIANANTMGDSYRQGILSRAAASGHEIGNHGLKDASMAWLAPAEFEAALDLWERRVAAQLPQWPARKTDRRWFRPPKALMSPAMSSGLEAKGYTPVLGDVYSDDWLIEDPLFHISVIEGTACDGSIMINHIPDRPNRMQTLEIVRTVVPLLKQRGFTFMRLSELFPPQLGEAPWLAECWPCVTFIGLAVVSILALVCRCVLSAVTVSRSFLRNAHQSARDLPGYVELGAAIPAEKCGQ